MKKIISLVAGVVLAAATYYVSGAELPFTQNSGVANIDKARQQLASLHIRAEHSVADYERDDWSHWEAVGGGCDAREASLKQHAEELVPGKGCEIPGGRWVSPYDTETVTDPSELDIDHVVPLQCVPATRLIIGTGRSAVGTLVERSSRSTILVHLPRQDGWGETPVVKNGPSPGGYGAVAMNNALADSITTLPEQLRETITWDRGKEMSGHAAFALATRTRVFFADPHSPWQRPTNENGTVPPTVFPA